jgi:uncharacterized protein YukE
MVGASAPIASPREDEAPPSHPTRGIRDRHMSAIVLDMARVLALAVVPVAVGVLTVAGCSSSGTPAVCSSVDDLKASVSNVSDVQSGENGLNTLKSNLAAVKDDLNQVLADAKSQYSTQVAQIRSDMTSLQSAVDTAQRTRSATDIDGAVTAAKALSTSVKGLGDDVQSTC